MIDKLTLRNSSQEEERLVQLFQNRAGLKKAHADLQEEFHLLRDRLKQQEGSTIRVQEQLDALGDLLGDPAAGFNALVFFQLRTLWKTCHSCLADFAGELTRQQDARETARHKADTTAARDARLADVDTRSALSAARADEERTALVRLQGEHDRLTAFWHYFNRRKLQKTLDVQRGNVAAADSIVGDLHAERSAIESESLPEFPGISLEARRTINLAIIGYAEILCERLAPNGLAARAKEVVARRVHEMNFGARAECDVLMQQVQQAMAVARDQREIAAFVKSKIEKLRTLCTYRNSADTVPTADSICELSNEDTVRAAQAHSRGASALNVLAEDYWDLYTVLLR